MSADGVGEHASREYDELDPVSREWMDALRAPGVRRVETLAELHSLLLRAARRELDRRRHWATHLNGKDRDDLAFEVAGDALVAIVNNLESYRGASRFTTWAYGFVIKKASTKLSREQRRPLPLTLDDQGWEDLPDRISADPHTSAELRDMLVILRSAVEQALTERQRQVFIALAVNQAPIDALAVQLGSTRNALYKTLFDARRKLRARLEGAGYYPGHSPPPDGPTGKHDNLTADRARVSQDRIPPRSRPGLRGGDQPRPPSVKCT